MSVLAFRSCTVKSMGENCLLLKALEKQTKGKMWFMCTVLGAKPQGVLQVASAPAGMDALVHLFPNRWLGAHLSI